MTTRELNWIALTNPSLGLLDTVSDSIANMEIAGSIGLPNLRSPKQVFLFSDYGGFHDEAGQEVYSILLVDEPSVAAFRLRSRAIRQELNLASSVVAFKRLREGKIARTAERFLAAADQLNGLLFSVGIDKSIKYMTPDALGGLPARFSHWQTGAFERMLRIANVATMLLSCLLQDGQDVVWISDEDQIMPSDRHGQDTVAAMMELAKRYFPILLGNLTAMPVSKVTASDRLLCEDLLSIPDLAAGALCEFTTGNLPNESTMSTRMVVPANRQPRDRSRPILDWYNDENQGLKRLFLELGPTSDPKVFSIFFRQIVKLPKAASSPRVLRL